MDIIKPIIDFGQLLPISLLLKPYINEEYFDKIIFPALQKIALHNNISIRRVKNEMIVFYDEIVVKFEPPNFYILCNHEFYDGKVISNLCLQLNNYIENKTFMEPIVKKNIERSITNIFFRCIVTKLITSGFLGKKHMNIINTFSDPIKPSAIIQYIQNIEHKNIIYLRSNKEKIVEQGNSFNIYKIYNNQTLKDALSKNQLITKMDVPELLIKQNYIIANFYPHFHIPNFTEKMIFDNMNRGVLLLDTIASVVVVKTYVLTPKSASNTYDLYEVIY